MRYKMQINEKILLLSVVKKFKGGAAGGSVTSVVKKEVSSWKLGARIKKQTKIGCVGGLSTLSGLCVSFITSRVWVGLCALCVLSEVRGVDKQIEISVFSVLKKGLGYGF